MIRKLLSLSLFLPLALLAWTGFVARQVQAADGKPAGPVASSEPATNGVNSNLHNLNDKKNGLKELEDDLFKPLKRTLSPKSSLDAVMIPQARPSNGQVIQSKKAKELRDKQKEWVFMSPEEIADASTMEEVFNVSEFKPDGGEEKKLSPMEKYYLNLDRRNGQTNRSRLRDGNRYGSRKQTDPREEAGPPEESKLAGKLSETEARLKKSFDSDPDRKASPAAPNHGTLSDIFGMGNNKPSPEWTKAQRGRMDEFKQIIGFPGASAAAGADSFSSVPGMGSSMSKPMNPVIGFDIPRPSGFDAQLGALNTLPGFGALPDMNARAFVPPSFTAPLPRIEPPRMAPPLPSFDPPKRSF